MPDFLSATPDAYSDVSPGFVESVIQSRRQELFTGFVRLRYPSGEIFVLSFVDGAEQKLYRCLEKSTEVIPRSSWSVALDLPNASVSSTPMSVESMRLMHVAHEAPISRTEQQTLALPELFEKVKEWSKCAESAIVHIRADHLDRLYLMSGIFNPVIESLAFGNGGPTFSINDVSFPTLFAAADYHVTRYVSDRAHVTWQEYEVRLAFNPWMRLILNRFSELAGRMLTERLSERISTRLQQQGWNLRVSINGISNHQIFESLKSAVDVYLGIILSFHEEASPAIGRQMAEGLSHDVLAKLDSYRRETILHTIYDQNRIDAVTGRVWR